jgi:Xaa-Pro aminopeptidase
MALHFDRQEYNARIKNVCAKMAEQDHEGMLIFQQESMYYLTGYDTFGFCFFQCLYLSADGTMALLTRSADYRQAQHTSTLSDIRIWTDEAGATPVAQLKTMLRDLGAGNKRLGVEYNSYGLTAHYGKALDQCLDGFCQTKDASDLITTIRSLKSNAEIAYVRRAGALGDAALTAAIEATHAGADEGNILAAMHNEIFKGGGDYPANEFIIGSAEDALLCRYKAGRRKLDAQDQLTLEWAGVYRHYHAAAMRTLVIGTPNEQHLKMHAAAQDALSACEACMTPGHSAGDIFSAHAQIMDKAGLKDHRLNACGYSLGAKFTPSWMDAPMFYANNAVEIVPNMVLFAHMILMDSTTNTAITLGRSYITTDDKPEPLSTLPLDLIVK